ncbi:MAG: hypothetical protein KGJ80_10470 [Chloroflexota bacterium]|nr:hypothetical protein [Chloroflexota bacterium]
MKKRISVGYSTILLLAASIILLACDIEIGLPNAEPSKPTGGITSPPHGSQFLEGDLVTVQSFASDAAGIARVDLHVDRVAIRADVPPSPQGQTYFAVAQNWQAVRGTHTITVRAYSVKGAVSDIGSVMVTVGPPATPVATLPPVAPPPAPSTLSAPAATVTPTVTLTPTPTPTPTSTPLPQGNCADPNARWENVTDGQTIGELMAFIGTAAGDNFAEYRVLAGTPGTVLYRSSTPVTHGVIFVWNTLTVGNGDYLITLIVSRTDGTSLALCALTIKVRH